MGKAHSLPHHLCTPKATHRGGDLHLDVACHCLPHCCLVGLVEEAGEGGDIVEGRGAILVCSRWTAMRQQALGRQCRRAL